MRRQITFTLNDKSIFKVFAIVVKGSNLRINIKHVKNKTVVFSDSFESNVDNIEGKDVEARISEISISSLLSITSSSVSKIDSDIAINIDGVNAMISGSNQEKKNAGIERSAQERSSLATTNSAAAEILEVIQRGVDKPSAQINFTDLSRSIMQTLDNARNFTTTTSENESDAEDRFQVFHRLLGLFGGLVSDVRAADISAVSRSLPASHIFFRMSHDLLDPENKNTKEFKRKIDELVSLMRQKKLEQAKEIAFVKTQTRSGLVPFYLFQNNNAKTKNVTQDESVIETAIGPDSLSTRAILQEGYDQDNAPFEMGDNQIGSEWMDANLFNLRKQFIGVESSYQNLPEGDILKSNIGPSFVEMSKASTDRIERAFSKYREGRRSLVQRRLLREIENILLEGGSGIGVGIKYVACAFGVMLDAAVIKYQCSECTHFAGGSGSSGSTGGSSTGCLKGYTDGGEPKQAVSFCGNGETPAGGTSPQGIEYTMNKEISDKVVSETKARLSRA